jgi:membrane protease YdiL (CAAX protease family)
MPNWHDPATLDVLDDVLVAAGAVVLLAAVVRHVRQGWRNPLRGSPLRTNVLSPAWVWLALMAYIFSSVLAGLLARAYNPRDALPEDIELWQNILTGNLMQVFVVLAVLWIARYTFLSGLRGFGLHVRSWPRDVLGTLAGWLAATCLCLLVAWTTEWLIHRFAPRFEMPAHNVFVALRQTATPVFIRVVAVGGAIILAPLGEELLFRGILQTSIRKLIPARSGSLRHRWAAIAITAVLFGAMHYATPQFVPALTVFGLVLGYLYERTGSLWIPVLVHMLFNGKTLLWYHLQAGTGL